MADTVAVMNQGRVDQLGAPEELYENPATTYVANFLGQSNLIRAMIRSRTGGDVVAEVGGEALRVPGSRCPDAVDDIYLGVRPEKVRIGRRTDPVPGGNQLDGVVTDSSFTGVSTQYLVRLSWGQEITVFVQNVSGGRFTPGEEVTVSWQPEHSFGLDAAQNAHAGEQQDAAATARMAQ